MAVRFVGSRSRSPFFKDERRTIRSNSFAPGAGSTETNFASRTAEPWKCGRPGATPRAAAEARVPFTSSTACFKAWSR